MMSNLVKFSEQLSQNFVYWVFLISWVVAIIFVALVVLTMIGRMTRIIVGNSERFRNMQVIYKSMDNDYAKLARKLRVSNSVGEYMSLMATPVLTLLLCSVYLISREKHNGRGQAIMQKKWYEMSDSEFSLLCLKYRVAFQFTVVATVTANIYSTILSFMIEEFFLWLLLALGLQAVFAMAYTVELKIILPIVRSNDRIRQFLKDQTFNKRL